MEEKIIERLLNELKGGRDLFFTEIENIFKEENFDYKGNKTLLHPKNTNLILWAEWNEQAINIIRKLLEIPEIYLTQCTDLEIVLYGVELDFPIAKRENYNYTKTHWFPIKLNYKK